MDDALAQKLMLLKVLKVEVLILVVMDDALAPVRLCCILFNYYVLILVVMDDALALFDDGEVYLAANCLNPCCNG